MAFPQDRVIPAPDRQADTGQGADALRHFSGPTRDWFTSAFPAATAVQIGAWNAIAAGQHALVVAPTGSGKTLAAFLWALDRLANGVPATDPTHRCRVVYISPLKALAVDIERNLRAPLIGIRQSAVRSGAPVPDVRVAVRSGDTPPDERREFQRRPPDVLITTPESLFLLLTSQARTRLAGVETVIIDEVHAVAGSKRGAHLALSLERLDALTSAPTQRIGLSATVRPVDQVARWLGGAAASRVQVVQPPAAKTFDLEVVVPVPDMADLDASRPPGAPEPGQAGEVDPASLDLTGLDTGTLRRPSIWPQVEERVVDLVAAHHSTLVFTNSRRLAERLTARLNEIWTERLQAAAQPAPNAISPSIPDSLTPSPKPSGATPAEIMAGSGSAEGAPPVLARAHHGSVSREQRALIEGELKAGRLPAVVATSSLELGIDMGAVDLVVQVESPPSVASGLQRVGRAGHQVGAISRGVLFPKYRADLVQTAVVVERMRSGQIEQLEVPANPLDVLAQQIVAIVAMEDITVETLQALIQRSAPFSALTRSVLESVLDMLAGRYPSHAFAELRPRIVWDRLTDTLTARPGAQRLAVTSGGTIPDRGLFGVFLATDSAETAAGTTSTAKGGRRVGELDEEMVYESRVGDVFALGSSSWRIQEITHDRVLVTPAPGQPARLPFWKGDTQGRPAELGRAIGGFIRELSSLTDADATRRVRQAGLDDWAADNLLTYLREQLAAVGHVSDDRTIVVERFRDELGDWRVVIHSPFGNQVHTPWSMAIAARLRETFGVDVQAMAADDGIVLRLPDLEFEHGSEAESEGAGANRQFGAGAPPAIADLIMIDPVEIEQLVTDALGGSALFASRFRECAGRALLLPRRRPGQRQPLWQQRQRAAQLLDVASEYPGFPIVLETVRECLQDVFDVPALAEVLAGLQQGAIRILEVTTQEPSPFARSLTFGYVAQFLYEGDSPLAERRAAALTLDPQLLAELLGRGEGAALRDLLDPAAITRTESELQRLTPERRLVGREGTADLLRLLGPMTLDELTARTLDVAWSSSVPDSPAVEDPTSTHLQARPPAPTEPPPTPADLVSSWLETLRATRRVIEVRIGGQAQWAAVEDAGRLRDALGTPLPVGVATAFTEPVPDPLGDLVLRYARTHGPFTAAEVAQRFGIGTAVAVDLLHRLGASGRVVSGELRPIASGGGVGVDYCDRDVLRTLRRRSVAALRAEVEPVSRSDLAAFLPQWHGITSPWRGAEGVLRAVEQLAGAVVPASAVETLILPARVMGYTPAMLDELLAADEVLWVGHAPLAGDDGWVSLHLSEFAPLTLTDPDPEFSPGPLHDLVLDALASGGAYHFRALSERVGSPDDASLVEALWDLLWAGRIRNDSLASLRHRLAGGRSAHRTRRPTPRGRYGSSAALLRLRSPQVLSGRPTTPTRTGPPLGSGRWVILPPRESDPTVRAHARAEILLERYAVLTRGAVAAEGDPGGFAAAYRVLSAFEDAGRVRRGYFVEGLGAAQFATTATVDRLRAAAREAASDREAPGDDGARRTVVLAACDPANAYGAALSWPDRTDRAELSAESGESINSKGSGTSSTVGRARAGHRPGRKAGALVVLVDGDLVLYLERGGRSVLSWSEDEHRLTAAADALALAVRDGALGRLTVHRADGETVLGRDTSLSRALLAAGFHVTPKGLRIRSG